MFQEWLLAAKTRLSLTLLERPPVVISSDNMNESNPVNLCLRVRFSDMFPVSLPYIVATLQAGFHWRALWLDNDNN